MWFLEEFAPGGAEYVTALALRLHGHLDVRALGAALCALVERHESLRTTFDAVDGHGVQVVHPPGAVALPAALSITRHITRQSSFLSDACSRSTKRCSA